MDNKTARQDLETVLRVEDLALGSMRKLRAIQDWLREKAAAKAGELPELTSWIVNDCCWKFVESMPHNLPSPIFNDLKPALYAAIKEYHGKVFTAKALPSADTFQKRVKPWLLECFGELIADDKEERNHRFLEEALELVQACYCTAEEAHKLVDYVFSRPVGEKSQEVGGVHVTLAALCLAQGIDGQAAAEAELSRITQPEMVERIREKQKRKPSMSPLPGVYPDREKMTSSQASQENTHG